MKMKNKGYQNNQYPLKWDTESLKGKGIQRWSDNHPRKHGAARAQDFGIHSLFFTSPIPTKQYKTSHHCLDSGLPCVSKPHSPTTKLNPTPPTLEFGFQVSTPLKPPSSNVHFLSSKPLLFLSLPFHLAFFFFFIIFPVSCSLSNKEPGKFFGIHAKGVMSCNGCRVLRKGCSESCILRPCLQWIESPEAQGHATVFVAKFFGRAGLMSFISAVPESQRPGICLVFFQC